MRLIWGVKSALCLGLFCLLRLPGAIGCCGSMVRVSSPTEMICSNSSRCLKRIRSSILPNRLVARGKLRHASRRSIDARSMHFRFVGAGR